MSDLDQLIDAAKRGDLAKAKSLLESNAELVHERDSSGATALHFATLGGHRGIVEALIAKGADINAADSQFGTTPAGWAIEYLREMGGFLGIELADFAYAIERRQVEWVARFLDRFPALREATDSEGTPFRFLAEQSGDREITKLFGP